VKVGGGRKKEMKEGNEDVEGFHSHNSVWAIFLLED